MFEYMNTIYALMTFLIVLGTLVIALHEKEKSRTRQTKMQHQYILYLASFASVVMLFNDMYEKEKRIHSNIDMFKKEQTLRCRVTGKSYLVSQERGWRVLDKESLIKGDLILRINSCQEEEKINE